MSCAAISLEWTDPYERAFILDVHQLIAWGYGDAKDAIINAADSEGHEEESITGLIREAIDIRLNRVNPAGKFGHYYARETSPESNGNRRGKRRLELDLEIICGAVRPRRRTVFEAKRLCANGFPISGYTGKAGLECFIRGEYGADCPFTGMLGYVQSHTPTRWFSELQKSFAKRYKQLRASAPLIRTMVIPSLSHEWTSEHIRDNGTVVRVFHVFLDCR